MENTTIRSGALDQRQQFSTFHSVNTSQKFSPMRLAHILSPKNRLLSRANTALWGGQAKAAHWQRVGSVSSAASSFDFSVHAHDDSDANSVSTIESLGAPPSDGSVGSLDFSFSEHSQQGVASDRGSRIEASLDQFVRGILLAQNRQSGDSVSSADISYSYSLGSAER